MIKFFRCSHCGKVIVKVVDSDVPTVCCGEAMKELVANTTDAVTEKHLPVVEKGRCKTTVKIGSVPHPMTPEHYINFIVMANANGYEIRFLNPTKNQKVKAIDEKISSRLDDMKIEITKDINAETIWRMIEEVEGFIAQRIKELEG